jgi:hypothetical protein
LAPDHEFVPVISEMRDRTAEGAHAELEKSEKNLAGCSSRRNFPGE